MNIQVRVAARAALAQLAAIEKELRVVQVENRKAAVASSMIGSRGVPSLTKWGSQLQWAGRQLTYNFTLPLVLAGAAATKFELDNEKAMTRVSKVYGDGSAAMNRVATKELPALKRAFRALSDEFGVNQAAVINVGADWAAAGASGLALAKATKLTLETMVLGEMEAKDATRDLIAIQAQYGVSTDGLRKIIDTLNMVENQTGTSMQDLIVVMSKSAGSARSAGVSYRQLASLTAALVPAAGSAASAGNALKTIFSRILAPTKQAADVMKAMGINTHSTAWESTNAVGRLKALADKFVTLTGSQRSLVTSLVAGRYQLNRFDVLLRALTNRWSFYNKALKSTQSNHALIIQREKELSQVLQSQPQLLKTVMVRLENLGAQIIAPLVPLIISFANSIKGAVEWFTGLDPRVQRLVITLLGLLAIFGPIIRYIGATVLLIGYLGRAVFEAGKLIGLAGKLMLAPFMLLYRGIAAVVTGAVGALSGFVAWLARGFGGAIASVLRAVVGAVAVQIGRLAAIILLPLRAVMAAVAAAIGAMVEAVSTAIAAMVGLVMRAGLVATFLLLRATLLRIWALTGAQLVAVFSGWFVAFGRMVALGGTALIGGFARLGGMIATIFTGTATFVAGIWTRMWAFIAGGGIYRAVLAGVVAFRTGFLVIIAGLRAGVLRLLVSPWVIVVLAIISVISALRDKLASIWAHIVGSVHGAAAGVAGAFSPVVTFFQNAIRFIQRAFDSLPVGVKNAIMAVVRVVAAAAKQVYEWFSYLNPFAHHSPSLVENVTGGMNVVRNQHEVTNKSTKQNTDAVSKHHTAVGRTVTNSVRTVTSAHSAMASSASSSASRIGSAHSAIRASTRGTDSGPISLGDSSGASNGIGSLDKLIKQTQADMASFRAASKGLIPSEWADQIKAIKATMPGVLPSFMKLLGDLRQMNAELAREEAAIKRQTAVVDQWKTKLDVANKALDAQQAILDKAQKKLDGLQNQYDAAQSSMQNFASAPIKGMQAFSDKIFNNSEAQKKLQLQMLQWEKSNGSLDDMKNKVAAINGEISNLQGTAADLRSRGAGSDVLGPLNDQIAALQKQADATNTAILNSPVSDLQKKMDELQRSGEILQLQNDIKFDPLQHQIEKLANTTKELTYDQIVHGIQSAKAKMAELTPKIKDQTDVVNAQTKTVNQATRARDRIQKRYDAESAKLDNLTKKYNDLKDSIAGVTDELNKIGSAATAAASAKAAKVNSTAADFAAAGSGDFAQIGGTGKLGREGSNADQSKAIDKFVKQSQDDLAKRLGGLDMFGPLKGMWKSATDWMKKYIGPVMKNIKGIIETVFKGAGQFLGNLFKNNTGTFRNVGNVIGKAFHAVGTAVHGVTELFKLFWPNIKSLFLFLGELAKRIWDRLVPALVKFWNAIKPLVEVIAVALIGAFKIWLSFWQGYMQPLMDTIINIISDILNVVADLVNFVVDVLTGKWGKAWDDIVSSVKDAWQLIWDVIGGFIKVVWGGIKGFIDGVVGFFKWLYDELVGHSIIPDMVKEIVKWFEWIVAPIKAAFNAVWWGIKTLWNNVALPIFGVIKTFIKGWAAIFTWVWNNVIKPAWNALWWGIKAVWNNLALPIFNVIKGAIKTWGAIFSWIWNNLIKPAWHALWNGVKAAWNLVGKPIFDTIGKIIRGIKTIISDIAKPVKSAFESVMNGILTAVGAFKKGLGKAWDVVKKIFGSPIYFVVHSILNPLITGLDYIPGVDIPHIPDKGIPHFARGGKVPGNHNRDDVLISATPGEVVVPKHIVKAFGGAGDLMKQLGFSGMGKKGHFAGGGQVTWGDGTPVDWGKTGGTRQLVGGNGVLDTVAGWATGAVDKAFNALRKGAANVFVATVANPIKKLDNQLDHFGAFGKMMNTAMDTEIDSIVAWIRGKEAKDQKRIGNSLTAPIGDHYTFIDKALRLAGHKPSVDLESALNTIISYESGWNAKAVNRSDSNWKAGHPSVGLMQTIAGTWARYVPSSLRNIGPFEYGVSENPFSNTTAGIRYADARYGGLNNVPGVVSLRNGGKYVGYDAGGLLPPGVSQVINNTGRPELIAPARIFHQAMADATTRSMKLTADATARASAKEQAQTRLSATATAPVVYHNENNSKTWNITLQAEFPNITSPDDAEKLLANLEAIGDGAV